MPSMVLLTAMATALATVSSTQCCKSLRRVAASLAASFSTFVITLGLVLATTCLPAQAADPGAEITQLTLERSEEGILLSASVKFDIPPLVDDALAKGIPMFFVAEAQLFRDRWYWYDKHVLTAARHMRVSYQPLTRRWRLEVS